ncbi:hypothetical protein SUGI_1194510 [Cryptomeria japonica]|uniref:putative RING-H2 finger protein ATL49 n=1 Tax=Cryptomeria japonica TaxID=3369 RepID=UPI00241472E3|nr:putative RING-H2 finger protein ATL49 [Cryptomeria japonica]GLJ55619.1 hypothetical protein SUGI_1194510 [Cryptomeria japonica]
MRRTTGSVIVFLWVVIGFSLYPILSIKTEFFASAYVRAAYICVVVMGGVIVSFWTGDESGSGQQQQSPPSSSDDVDKIAVEVEMGVFNYRCNGGGKQEEDCVICLCEFEEDEQVVALKPCHHNFHVDCIRKWLKCKLRCPTCNATPLQKFGSHAQNDVTLEIPPPPPPPAAL